MNTQNNRLIDKFLGKQGQHVMANITTCYDTDWNSLIQVVEKIESLGFDFNILTPTVIEIWNGEGEQLIYVDGRNSKIEAVYNACIEFIKWYNEQKEKE